MEFLFNVVLIILFNLSGCLKEDWYLLYNLFIFWFFFGIVYYLNFIGLLESVVILKEKFVLLRWYIGKSVLMGWLFVEKKCCYLLLDNVYWY